MKIGFSTAGAIAFAIHLSAPPAFAAMAVAPQDAMFATKAAQGGMAEVTLAGLALQKSQTPGVVAFATQMRADHSKANSQLMSIIAAKGMAAPHGVGPENRAVMARLQGATGAAFDTAYLKTQLPAHRQALALYKAEAAAGKDADLVAFAKQTIPVIVGHIAMDKRDIAKVAMSGMSMK